jgi:hypothetical protein
MTRGSRSAPERSTASRRLLALIIVPLGFALIMIVAALQGTPRIRILESENEALPMASEQPQPTVTPGPPLLPEQGENPVLKVIAIIIAAILTTAAVAVLVFLVILLVRKLISMWRDRALPAREGAEIDDLPAAASVAPTPDAVVIRRGIAEAIRVMGDVSDPGDAIIAAWVGLEQTAADSGVTRAPSETPREFTLRIIARRGATQQDVTALVDLYEQVRFGGHLASDDDRAQARTLLARLEEEWR